MALPLHQWTAERSTAAIAPALCRIQAEPTHIPATKPGPGEQYRFHFDMTKCIGCHCCEVACSEQNSNPPHIQWRRVGEVEGGIYPVTQRLNLSMGCNHCIDPSCLKGCPVDAYTKDALTGIVLHSADMCIGCQYCTWNCQYGVPQYNEERGAVGKCDMCYNRLDQGRAPACVSACPEGAIQIELVNVAAWKEEFTVGGNAPGMPLADMTVSTTRITQPQSIPAQMRKADINQVRPEHPHTPLIVMTVLTQLSAGAFAALWLTGSGSKVTAAVAFLIANIALGASTLHLGRPIHAYRALKMWRRSWLSREVVAFTLFAGAASVYAGALWFALPIAPLLGAATTLFGVLGITASAFIYLVPARPAWNTVHTIAEYFLTAALLGPMMTGNGNVSLFAAALITLNFATKYFRLSHSHEWEMQASAKLLAGDLRRAVAIRFAMLAIAVILMIAGAFVPALIIATASELFGRYLFFVSVVPRNIASTFFMKEAA